jgi:hypothetical protein
MCPSVSLSSENFYTEEGMSRQRGPQSKKIFFRENDAKFLLFSFHSPCPSVIPPCPSVSLSSENFYTEEGMRRHRGPQSKKIFFKENVTQILLYSN